MASRPFFDPPLQVVVPPRPNNPELLGRRLLEILDSGNYKFGHRWTTELTERVAALLGLGQDRELLPTVSGTAALRLAASALRGTHPRNGRQPVAVLPSYTFPATGEFLRQLGFELIFCDVDSQTWNVSSEDLALILQKHSVDLVVCVDALGNPANYTALVALCHDAGVPLLADSASGLGSRHQSLPVGTQADAHAFSMSMAKVVSAAGAGGFVVLPAGSRHRLERDENWIRSSLMTEMNAVVALDQLDNLVDLLARRAGIAGIYKRALSSIPGLSLQHVADGDTHSWVHAVVRCRPPHDRDKIAAVLARFGIETKPYYAPPLHTFLPNRNMPRALPETETLVSEVLALPISSEMNSYDADLVVDALRLIACHRD